MMHRERVAIDRSRHGRPRVEAGPWAANDDEDLEAVRAVSGARARRDCPMPPDEDERIAALRSLDLLDTPRDPTFDRIVDLAQRVVGGTMAAVSLVDAERQWFKARLGLALQETPREVAFCRYTIMQDDVLVVEDAAADPRFRDNPLVTGPPGVRFYAGAPIRSPDGHAIGTLCVLDTEARRVAPTQRLLIRLLADLAEDAVRLHQTRKEADGALAVSTRQREALHLTSRQLAHAEEAAELGIFTFDVMSEVAYFSRAFHEILGDAEREITFAGFLERLAEDDRARVSALLRGTDKGPLQLDRCIERLDGVAVWVRLSAELHQAPGERTRIVGTLRDVTEERRRLDQIEYLIRYDPLTGLMNRDAFERAVEGLEARARPDGFAVLALVGVDVTEDVRERFGRKTAEKVLATVGERLGRSIRSDGVLARFAENVFAVAVEQVPHERAIGEIGARLAEALRFEMSLEGETVEIGGGIGYAVAPGDRTGAEDLVDAAEIALKEARRRGRGHVLRFDRRLFDRRTRHRTLIEEVRAGIVRGEFEAFLQPKVELSSGAPVGFEALLRWRHPARGVLGPGAFLAPLDDDETGAALSDVSLSATIALARRFIAAGHRRLRFSINLNGGQLARDSLVGDVLALCRTHQVPPAAILFEVVESVLLRENERVLANLALLSQNGFGVSLDDFGTGYASLTNIREPFIREIKIDRSFVRGSATCRQDLKIVEALVSMARNMDLSVVAEGVETAETAAKLMSLGCEIGQGFHFAPPLCEADAFAFLAADPAGRRARGTA